MAKLESALAFTGSIGNISAYRMRGVDKIILRGKGGPSKNMIKKAPQFAITRRLNTEFAGRAYASSLVVNAMLPLKALADYNLYGPINGLLKFIQELDTTSEMGKRSIMMSCGAHMLSGFSLNRKYTLENIIRSPIKYTIDPEGLSSQIEIPALSPRINFHTPANYAYYSFISVLGIVPDIHLTGNEYKQDGPIHSWPHAVISYSDWYPVMKGSPTTFLSLQQTVPPHTGYCLLLSMGIRFGAPGTNGIEQVRYAGAGKILSGIDKFQTTNL